MLPKSEGREALLKCTPVELQSTRTVYFSCHSIADFQFLDMFPQLRTMQIRHLWHDLLVNITPDAIEVVSVAWGAHLRNRDFRHQRENSLRNFVDRLQAWKPTAKISVRRVGKHDATTRW
jgi:hypothetical protein